MKSVLSWRDEAKRLAKKEYKYGPKDMDDIGEMYRQSLITKEEAGKLINDSLEDITFKCESMRMSDYRTANIDYDGRFYNEIIWIYNLNSDWIRTALRINTNIDGV